MKTYLIETSEFLGEIYMKKIICFLMAVTMCLAMTACGEGTSSTSTSSSAVATSSAGNYASSVAPSSASASSSESTPVAVYSDSMIDVNFEKVFNQEGMNGELFITLTVKNNSSKSITVSLTDVYVDDTMMQTGSGVPLKILPGKNGTGTFFGKNSTKPNDIKKIGFKVYLLDDSASSLETTKQIEVKLK